MEDVQRMLEGDILTPSQFYDSRRGTQTDDPLRRLMFAVLRDALICLSARLGSAVRPRDVREAMEWVGNETDDHPFSFNSVCDSLGINPGALRTALKDWLDSGKRLTRRSPVIPLSKMRGPRSRPIERPANEKLEPMASRNGAPC